MIAPRQEFKPKVKIAAFQRAEGRCERCRALLCPGKFRYNHRIPDQLGGQPTLENCEVLCLGCDSEQTYKIDIPLIAKSKRIRARHAGVKRESSSRSFPCGRNTPWRKKISGEVVRR